MQVFVAHVLAHGSGRFAMKCIELGAPIHNSKVLGVGPMLPKAPLTKCTGEENEKDNNTKRNND